MRRALGPRCAGTRTRHRPAFPRSHRPRRSPSCASLGSAAGRRQCTETTARRASRVLSRLWTTRAPRGRLLAPSSSCPLLVSLAGLRDAFATATASSRTRATSASGVLLRHRDSTRLVAVDDSFAARVPRLRWDASPVSPEHLQGHPRELPRGRHAHVDEPCGRLTRRYLRGTDSGSTLEAGDRERKRTAR